MEAHPSSNLRDAVTRRLRIGFCISLYWPVESGAERQAQRQAKELSRRGHQVTVYTRPVRGRPSVEWDGDVIVRRTIRTCDLGPLFGVSFVSSLVWQLWRDHRQLDVLHCHQGAWEAVGAGWAHHRLGLPTIVQPAAGGPYGEVHMLRRVRGRRWVLPYFLSNSHFVAISEQIERELLDLGVPRARLDRFASGVDVDEFAPGESRLDARLGSRPRVLFLGRLHPQKNLATLLKAWRHVLDQVPHARLLLAGDGPLRESLAAQVDELKMNDGVSFLGQLSDPLPYLQASDALVLPSISEGMSNSLLEAMACGLPAVVSSAGGNVDLVEHEHCGLVADASDSADLARQLVRILRDDSLRHRLGLAARQKIVAQYSLASVVDRYELLYQRLARRSDAPDS